MFRERERQRDGEQAMPMGDAIFLIRIEGWGKGEHGGLPPGAKKNPADYKALVTFPG